MSKHAPHTPIQNPVEGLKTAMLERARKLAEEHLSQGKLSRQKILQDAREKVHLMEQKELLWQSPSPNAPTFERFRPVRSRCRPSWTATGGG